MTCIKNIKIAGCKPNKRAIALNVLCIVSILTALLLCSTSLSAKDMPGTIIINSSSSIKKYRLIQQAFEKNFQGETLNIDLADNNAKTQDLETILQQYPESVIYTIGTPAFIKAYKTSEQNNIIFSSTLNWRRLPVAENIYGIANEPPPLMQLTLYRYLFPKINNIGVIYSQGYNREWLSEAMSAADEVGLTIKPAAIENPSQLRKALTALLPEVDVLWLISDPIVIASPESAKLIFTQSRHTKKPIFAYDKSFSQHALLIISADIPTMGQQVANLANQLLGKQQAPNHVINPAGTYITLNIKKLKAYQIELNNDALDSVNEIIE